MTFISNETLYSEQQEIKRMLRLLLDREAEHSIEELSLHKASKLLRLSPNTVVDLVKKGKLKSRTYKDANRKTRYRFRIAEIHSFQNHDQYEAEDVIERDMDLETTEELADRIFPGRKKK